MALDPRTPVVVGVGQVVTRADAPLEPAERPEPVALMAMALRAAAEDCDGAAPGAAAPAGDTLLRRADSLRVVVPLGWHSANPAFQVAHRLGFAEGDEPAQLMLSSIGGNTPQALMHDACGAISRGALDVVLVTGAEAMYARALSRRDRDRAPLVWEELPPEGAPAPTIFGVDKAGATDLEMQRGVILPVHAYPLFENALRAAHGWSLDEHAARIGRVWSRFSEVAAANPYAWIRSPRTPDEIVTPSPDNRMVSFPYPKLCTANMQVDQGAGYIVCSVEAARAAGVPEDRWVFPLAGSDANDHWYISDRAELHRSPAIRLAGQAALAGAGLGIDDIDAVDLYSCFPVVVQMAAAELGLGLDEPDRPLTLTGGLTFGGGPGNNYTSHGIASAVSAVRGTPGSTALVTGLGWYATKHSLGVYASRPPDHGGSQPFAWHDAQPEVDALPTCAVDPDASGPVRVETYTVTFDRDGNAERGILACRTGDGTRAWANTTDADTLKLLCSEEGIGRTGSLAAGGTLTLDD
jgi:acetyl-CoA C-acetyltransferase